MRREANAYVHHVQAFLFQSACERDRVLMRLLIAAVELDDPDARASGLFSGQTLRTAASVST
ncbi:hypothetical protein QN219_31955 [Sinorhizobium sp. 7-81]|uniref:hypothetical protein n=1 Tax=unclassified Sinorhizobium TaxID=2613772 RepID=UPI0024C2E735|nr:MULTISPECIES: hypothetical protein [unclassified Sinorhizobium]MDK1389940.1 hypothetical protein [Sinorhizobium sp. 7-81]MDK1494540.1 hypothetical protein [Sinorhizobium sp. 8-89]